jgi:cytochrome c2
MTSHARTSRALRAALAAAALAFAGGCERGERVVVPTGGDPERGRTLIAAYDCGACHAIPGVRGARGVVGPPLDRFALRSYIGGRAPNTPENLVRWVQDPSALAPGTAMPKIGLDEQEARDVAAYLYELR